MAYRQQIRIDSAADCIQPKGEVPTTPENIKKFRKSYKQQPGVTILHHGKYDTPQLNTNLNGKKQIPSDKIEEVIKVHGQGVQQQIKNANEQRYSSQQKMPLGNVPSRNYIWPQQIQQNNFFFGQPTQMSDSSKQVVFPPNYIEQTEEQRLQYVKTHGNYEVGEQKKRDYNWNIQPQDHRFGKVEDKVQDQMKMILQQENVQDCFPPTKILQKNQQDFHNYRYDHLGQPKNLAQINQYIKPETAFGSYRKSVESNVDDCLKSQQNQMKIDPDLGKATKLGWRNETRQGDDKRTFGVPSIRTDIQKLGTKSIADPQNYGNEQSGIQILFPEKFHNMGLNESDFKKPRDKEEIRNIFQSIGFTYGIGKFQAIYNRALQIQLSNNDRVSVEAFKKAVEEMNHIQ